MAKRVCIVSAVLSAILYISPYYLLIDIEGIPIIATILFSSILPYLVLIVHLKWRSVGGGQASQPVVLSVVASAILTFTAQAVANIWYIRDQDFGILTALIQPFYIVPFTILACLVSWLFARIFLKKEMLPNNGVLANLARGGRSQGSPNA